MRNQLSTYTRLFTILALLVGTILGQSCEQESEFEKQQKESDNQIQNYLKLNNISAQQADNGIYYELLTENEKGRIPKTGEVMAVKYEIRTLDQKLLESHTSDSTLLKFGWNYIIPGGFNYGLDIMRKGEKIRIYVPSYLAYNSYSSGRLFPSFSNFILEIELVEIYTEDEVFEHQIDQIEAYIDTQEISNLTPTTSGLYFKPLNASGGVQAKTYHSVEFHFKRKYLDGTLIQQTEDDKPLTARLDSNQLVDGLREGLLKMSVGGKALLIMPSEIAFGPSVKVIPSEVRHDLWEDGFIGSLVDAYSIVVYEVEIVDLK
ncbi:MAG: FKBP-type peptidyl-prolyl cis-trans isomerase [Reichenbachiella sp.]|uniref:FKBP-type peptidyl-prolyl cis-trans isomerase n=1 Tax=Reichenbachiella sp. TaxID=2184521 RepID=UPI003265C4CE